MSLKNAFTLVGQPAADWSEFVHFWAKLADHVPANETYNLTVTNQLPVHKYNAGTLRQLFKWENITGEKLDDQNTQIANQIIAQLPAINKLATKWDEELFKMHFGRFSAVWQTYLMHLIQPDSFPIFDSHIYRAYTHLQTGKGRELKGSDDYQLGFYRRYQSFFELVRQAHPDLTPRLIDRAFWVFGRFLKDYSGFV
jgi:hypothetical protein